MMMMIMMTMTMTLLVPAAMFEPIRTVTSRFYQVLATVSFRNGKT